MTVCKVLFVSKCLYIAIFWFIHKFAISYLMSHLPIPAIWWVLPEGEDAGNNKNSRRHEICSSYNQVSDIRMMIYVPYFTDNSAFSQKHNL